jgi:hypothetical protein
MIRIIDVMVALFATAGILFVWNVPAFSSL